MMKHNSLLKIKEPLLEYELGNGSGDGSGYGYGYGSGYGNGYGNGFGGGFGNGYGNGNGYGFGDGDGDGYGDGYGYGKEPKPFKILDNLEYLVWLGNKNKEVNLWASLRS